MIDAVDALYGVGEVGVDSVCSKSISSDAIKTSTASSVLMSARWTLFIFRKRFQSSGLCLMPAGLRGFLPVLREQSGVQQ